MKANIHHFRVSHGWQTGVFGNVKILTSLGTSFIDKNDKIHKTRYNAMMKRILALQIHGTNLVDAGG